MKEIWKAIENFEGLYEISNFGNVRSLDRFKNFKGKQVKVNGILLRQSCNTKGYSQVYLSKEGKKYTQRVHRLVALTFLDRIEDKPQVNHKDGNKENNNVENLEWCDNSENQKHAFSLGLNSHNENHMKANIKNGIDRRKLTDEQVDEIKLLRKQGYAYKAIGDMFKVSYKLIEEIVKGRKYKHKANI